MKAPADKPLVEFVSGTASGIEVFASDKRATPVSRHLYGQFAEHLYNNVYSGMWAQVLRNTGFEPAKYFGSQGADDRERALVFDVRDDNKLRHEDGMIASASFLHVLDRVTARIARAAH